MSPSKRGRGSIDKPLRIAATATITPMRYAVEPGQRGHASVGVPDLPLTIAGLAFDGIYFAAWLHRLHHVREASSITGRADVLFDLRCHIEPLYFRRASSIKLTSIRLHASSAPKLNNAW